MHRLLETRNPLLRRAIAVLSAGLVLALAVLAASPELHERLHGHAIGAVAPAGHGAGHADGAAPVDDEDGCVVTLFAQGVVMPVALLALAAVALALRPVALPFLAGVALESPRYLRLPTQGPPAGLD